MSATPRTIGEALRWGSGYLEARRVPNPSWDAALLLAGVLGVDRARLVIEAGQGISPDRLSFYEGLIRRRGSREPLQYILGRQEFMSLEFAVNNFVLIPRPETEILVEEALARLRPLAEPVVADIGTGCGAIAVSLACYHHGCRVLATDVSAAALAVARENAARHGVAERVEFLPGDLLEPVAGPLDAVLSNPPYIPTAQLAGLAPEVRDHEPREALDGGDDGLAVIRRLIPAAAAMLAPGGFLAVEIGMGQARPVEALAGESFRRVEIKADYAGIERVVVATEASRGETSRDENRNQGLRYRQAGSPGNRGGGGSSYRRRPGGLSH